MSEKDPGSEMVENEGAEEGEILDQEAPPEPEASDEAAPADDVGEETQTAEEIFEKETGVSSEELVETFSPLPETAPEPEQPGGPTPLTSAESTSWSMIAHLSVLLNLVTGFLGPIVALVIYLIYKDRSRYVAYQSMQAFVFQLIWWVGAGALAAIAWTISGVLAAILIGLCLMPIALVISLIPAAALVYGVIAGVQTSQGQDFKYWLIGDWVRGILEDN